MFTPFSHPAILAWGTLIFFILWWLWYNPITPIGKIWISYFPMPMKEKMPDSQQFIVMLIFQLFMGFVVAHTVMVIWILLWWVEIPWICPNNTFCDPQFLSTGNLDNLARTLLIVKIYMGFVFIKDLGHWYFEKRPFALVLIGVGYYLVGILGVCGLLSLFL